MEEFDSAQLQQAQQNSELVAFQSRMIESAQKQSEDEHVRQAIAQSLEGVNQQPRTTEGDLNAAIQASLQSSERVFESDLDVSTTARRFGEINFDRCSEPYECLVKILVPRKMI